MKLKIKNFQAHKDTTIDFAPGVNYVIGANDSGKSAIIRALCWAINNKPNGTGFVSHFAKKDITSSTIEFDDHKVVRARGNNLNQYIIDNLDEPYKALAGKVPEEISEIINLDDINIQSQYEPYFLVCETPGKIAEKFNEVFELQIIDTSSSNIKSIISKINKDKEYTDKQKNELKNKICSLSWIDDVDGELIILESKKTASQEVSNTIEKTQTVITTIEKIIGNINNTVEFLTATQSYPELVETNKQISKLKDRIILIDRITSNITCINEKQVIIEKKIELDKQVDILLNSNEQIQKINDKGKKIKKVVNEIESIKKQKEDSKIILFQADVVSMLEKSNISKEITKKGKNIAGIVRPILEIRKKIKSNFEFIAAKEKKFKEILGNLKICPLCGKTL